MKTAHGFLPKRPHSNRMPKKLVRIEYEAMAQTDTQKASSIRLRAYICVIRAGFKKLKVQYWWYQYFTFNVVKSNPVRNAGAFDIGKHREKTS